MGVLLLLLVLALALLLALTALSLLRYNEWRRKGVPSPTPWPVFGNCLATLFQRENVFQTFERVVRQFPREPFVGLYAGMSPVLLVRDPEAIKNITVKDFHVFSNHKLAPDESIDKTFSKFVFCLADGEWKSTRNKLSPAFTSGRLKAMYPSVQDTASQFSECIRNSRDKDGDAPLSSIATRFGLDVIGSCALGIQAGALTDPEGSPYVKAVSEAFRFTWVEGLSSFLLMFVPGVYRLLRLPLLQEWRMVLMRDLLREAAEYREREPPRNRDIFDTLLSVKRSGEMSRKLFESQVMAMQVAGSETSAKAVTFALWELARHPLCQRRLRAELLAAKDAAKDEGLSYEVLHGLRYLDMVFKETLRLWPVLPWLDRICAHNYTIPGTNISLEKDTVVMIPVYSIHRDPQLYPDPDAFDPERFSDATLEKPFFPFGIGPRMCIGSRFATMTVKSAIAEVLLNFHVSLSERSPKEQIDLSLSARDFLITMTKELTLRFEPIT